MKTLSTILIVILLSGCAIPTVIKSKPEGATVYINETNMGKTPLTYSDTEILFSQKNVRLEMDGYKSFSGIIKKDQLKIGPLVGGCIVGVPLLWALGYAEEYTFELDQGHSSSSSGKSVPTKSTSEDQPKVIQAEPVTQAVTGAVEQQTQPSVSPQNTGSSIESMVVIESKAKLRKKPSSKANVVKNLKKGEEVQVIKQKDGWFLIKLAGGETGWCVKGSLARRN